MEEMENHMNFYVYVCVFKESGNRRESRVNVRQRLDLICKKYQWNASFTIYVYDIWAHAI